MGKNKNIIQKSKSKVSKPRKYVKRFFASLSQVRHSKRERPILITVLVSLSLGILFLIGSAILSGLHFVGIGITFFVLAILAIIASVTAMFYGYCWLHDKEQDSTSSLLSQMDAFDAGETRYVEPSWDDERSDALQKRMNAFLERTSRLLEEKGQSEGGKAPTLEVLSISDFKNALGKEVESNPSSLSCLLCFDLVSKSAPRAEAMNALKEALRANFPEDLLGEGEENSLFVYRYSASSKNSFRQKLESFIGSFSYCYTDPLTSSTSVYGTRVGGAYFPGVQEKMLLEASTRALKRSQGIELEEGNTQRYGKSINPHLPEIARRVEILGEENRLASAIMDGKEEAERMDNLLHLLSFHRLQAGFESAGIYLYEPETRCYRLYVHDEEEDVLGLAKFGEVVPAEELNPFYEQGRIETPFFCQDVLELPHDLSLRCQSLSIASFYLYSFRFGGEKTGLAYFSSTKPVSLSLIRQEVLSDFFPYASSYLLYAIKKEKEDLRHLILNAFCAKKESYCYTVDRETKRLVQYSENLPQKFKGAQLGEVCHRALFGYNEPCPNCPLVYGPAKRIIPALGAKEVAQSVLTYRLGQEGLATLLIEKEEPRATSTTLTDKALQIKNAKAFQIEANRELRNPLSRGAFLGIRLTNKAELLDRLADQNSNSLLGAVSREISSIGYDDGLYRFDPDTLVVRISASTNRSTLMLAIEDIADQIHGPLYAGSDSFAPQYAYSLLYYPSDVNNVNDLVSLFQTELLRSQKMGEGLISEVGKSRARKAYRPEYVESLLHDKLTSGHVDLSFAAMKEVSTNEVRLLAARADLIAEDHSHIHPEEFKRIGGEQGLTAQLDFACLKSFLDYYSQRKDTLFHDNGIQNLFFTMDESTFLDRNFIAKVAEYTAEFKVPSRTLVLAFNASFLEKNMELARSRIHDLHEIKVLLFVRHLHAGKESPQRFAEIGVDGIGLSPSSLADALNNESDRMAYSSAVNEIISNNLIPVCGGVKDEDGIRFVQDLGVPYAYGSYCGEALSPNEFETLLSYHQ